MKEQNTIQYNSVVQNKYTSLSKLEQLLLYTYIQMTLDHCSCFSASKRQLTKYNPGKFGNNKNNDSDNDNDNGHEEYKNSNEMK